VVVGQGRIDLSERQVRVCLQDLFWSHPQMDVFTQRIRLSRGGPIEDEHFAPKARLLRSFSATGRLVHSWFGGWAGQERDT
jgi:hypothetical protein